MIFHGDHRCAISSTNSCSAATSRLFSDVGGRKATVRSLCQAPAREIMLLPL
jgi:hypothetical protein